MNEQLGNSPQRKRGALKRAFALRFHFALFTLRFSLCAFHFALLSKTRFISIFVSSYETAV